jgi:hypothetical protein
MPLEVSNPLHVLRRQSAYRGSQRARCARALQPHRTECGVSGDIFSYGAVIQQVGPTMAGTLIFAFANGAHDSMRGFLHGVNPEVTQALRSADRGRPGELSGADLIAGGLEISEGRNRRCSSWCSTRLPVRLA